MDIEAVESTAAFSFCIYGENKVDALLLSKTIAGFAEMAQIIARSQEPDVSLNVDISAFRQGSFSIDFEIICKTAKTIFDFVVVASNPANAVTSIIKNVFEIKKHIKGKKPKEIQISDNDNAKIILANGKTLQLPKRSLIVFNNEKVDSIASDVASTSVREGFSITTKTGKSSYTAEDAQAMAKPLAFEKTYSESTNYINVELPIKKADILGYSSWEFRHEGRTIKAAMRDDAFMYRVHNGSESISAGDKINATVAVETTVDDLGMITNQKYTIHQVHGGVLKSNQLNIFDN